MSRRFLDRAFSQAEFHEGQRHSKTRKKPQKRKHEQETEVEPDVVNKIIQSVERKDYLKTLELPLPDIDELGNPVWPYDSSFISRKYRQMCLRVHPDKNAGERARLAFQLLNKAYKAMLNADSRNEVLKASCDVALEAKEKREAKATVSEKIKINAETIAQKRKLHKIQHEKFSSEIVRQVKERQSQSSAKRQMLNMSRYNAKQTEVQGEYNEKFENKVSAEESQDVSGAEATVLHPSMEADEGKADNQKSRIKNKLKSVKPREVGSEEPAANEEDREEWQAAVLSKAKQQRRKPRFMF